MLNENHRRTSGLLPVSCLAMTLALTLGMGGCATTTEEDATPTADPEHVHTVEGIREYRLENGMQVVLFPDGSRSSVFVNTTYFVGSRHEGYGETGMAHLLEHMLFYGTPEHPDVRDEISERGGRANATASFDRTNYFQSLPADDENVDWAIGMEADRMRNADFDQEDLASEMTVVRNEFEAARDNSMVALMDHMRASAYRWHGYGRTVLGAESDIENVPIERLHAFYERYYQPDNAMLVVSGRFDEDSVLETIQEEFGSIASPDRETEPLWNTYTREPTQHGPRETTVRRSGDNYRIAAAYHIPALAHEDYAALDLLGHILGNSTTGRLHKALVEPGIASDVGAFAMGQLEPGLMLAHARVPDDGDPDKAENRLLEVLAEIAEGEIREDEVRRARNSRQRSIERTLSNSERVGQQLTEWGASGDWRLLFLHRDRLEEVTVADIEAVADQYLRRDNRTLGRFIPDSEPERAEIPKVDDLVAKLDAQEFAEEGFAEVEDFDPTPENIHQRMTRLELDNGMEVNILPRETRGDNVHALLVLRHGDEDTLQGVGPVGRLTAGMLMRGTESRSRTEIRDEIDELQANLDVGGSSTRAIARLETDADTLGDALALTADILRNPTFEDSEFEEFQRAQLAQINQTRNNPQARAGQELMRILGPQDPDHPQYNPDLDTLIDQVSETTPEQLANFHERFYGADEASLVLVGPVDAEDTVGKLNALFGDWNAEAGYERLAATDHEIEPGTIEIPTPDQANAMLIGAHRIPVGSGHEDYPALELGNFMLGGGFLNSRLVERIRNEEGISYGVGSMLDVDDFEDTGTFQVMAMFNPQNRERLKTAMMEELERVVEEGFTEEEIEQAREGWLNAREVSRSNDNELASRLNDLFATDRDVLWEAELEERVRSLDADRVNQAMAEYLRPEALALVIAGDLGVDETEPVEEDAS